MISFLTIEFFLMSRLREVKNNLQIFEINFQSLILKKRTWNQTQNINYVLFQTQKKTQNFTFVFNKYNLKIVIKKTLYVLENKSHHKEFLF